MANDKEIRDVGAVMAAGVVGAMVFGLGGGAAPPPPGTSTFTVKMVDSVTGAPLIAGFVVYAGQSYPLAAGGGLTNPIPIPSPVVVGITGSATNYQNFSAPTFTPTAGQVRIMQMVPIPVATITFYLHVKDAGTGAAIAGATVSWAGVRLGLTNSTGDFTIGPTTTQSGFLAVQASGFIDYVNPSFVATDGQTYQISMTPGITLDQAWVIVGTPDVRRDKTIVTYKNQYTAAITGHIHVNFYNSSGQAITLADSADLSINPGSQYTFTVSYLVVPFGTYKVDVFALAASGAVISLVTTIPAVTF